MSDASLALKRGEWMSAVEQRIKDNPQQGRLARKYPLVLLHAERLNPRRKTPHRGWYGYSFAEETGRTEKHFNYVDIDFNGHEGFFRAHQDNLVVDLGPVDFETDPDPGKVDLRGKSSWSMHANAVEGHVYLIRIRHGLYTRGFVLMNVLALDPQPDEKRARYMAFIWRWLPGALIVPPLKAPDDNDLSYDGHEKRVADAIARQPDSKQLIGKYPLVVLHSVQHNLRLSADRWRIHRDFNFAWGSADSKIHQGKVHLKFEADRCQHAFAINFTAEQANLIVDLGMVEFTQDPDPQAVPINGEQTWTANEILTVEGHIYLLRVREKNGNNFFVLLKVAHVDIDSRFVAFFWRILPGGKVVKE